MKRPINLFFISMFTVSTLFLSFTFSHPTVYGEAIVQEGSVGGYVWELQGRLKFLGYYHGPIDGRFGWRTYWAVRNFQYNFGMTVDGVVGSETKDRLWKATKDWNAAANAPSPAPSPTPTATITSAPGNYVSHGFSANDLKLMANAVYGESRGEPYIGQVAVASVILNRTRSASFPNTPSGVIFQPGAFTAVADGQIWLSPNATAQKAVQDALNGWDPSGGAIYYFNPDTATSPWIWSRPQIKRIGAHIFCR